MDSAKARRVGELRSRFTLLNFRWVAVLLLLALLDAVNVVQRLPGLGHLYRTETTLMALQAMSGIIAFTAIVTRRQWAFFATCAWLILGTVRLLAVAHLQ
jgi:hypothetical protein